MSLELTVEALAGEAGVPVSTIRMYQHRGLLEPPVRRGRVAYYGDGHVERLALIGQLQDRGFSLAAIKETIDSWAAGHSLGHLVGAGDVVPALRTEPLRLSPTDFGRRFEGVDLTPTDMARAVELGLVSLDGTDVVVRVGTFADIGPELARMGVPVGEILDEYAAMSEAVAGLAERFRAVFDRHVWASFEEAGRPADAAPDLAATVDRLAGLAEAVVVAELRSRFADFAEDRLRQAADGAGETSSDEA